MSSTAFSVCVIMALVCLVLSFAEAFMGNGFESIISMAMAVLLAVQLEKGITR